MGATPQLPRDDFAKWMREIERRMALIEQRSPFTGTGLSAPVAGTTQVDGNLTVVGTFTALGKVSNDALTNPVSADINGANGIGLSVSTTSTSKATTSLIVPAGFTKALVRADALGQAANTTASADYLYVMADIQGVGGGEMYNIAASGTATSAVGIANRLLTGLSTGDTITCDAMSRTNTAGWAANGGNLWIIHMLAIWLR